MTFPLKTKVLAAIGLLAALILVWFAARDGRGAQPSAGLAAMAPEGPREYSCPMHPQIRQPEFGQCPLCGMDLVPIAAGSDDADEHLPRLQVTTRAAALMEVQTVLAERRPVQLERRFLGRLVYDETRLHDIVVRTEGQLERLFVNYTGVPVREGEHIAEIYSPEFYNAAQDLLVARSAGNDPMGVEAARRKLLLLHVSETEIERILETGQPAQNFTLASPAGGVITQLDARQGAWLGRGQRIAQVADLTALWALLDAYESDIALLHPGQEVHLEVAAFPGREFVGQVAYISPELNERTRTLEVRLNVANPDGRLRPGMFARARLRVSLAANGEAQPPELAAPYRCPMHPEVVGSSPAPCLICGMVLERVAPSTEAVTTADARPPLVIPATAPLLTGKRAVVYVQVPQAASPTFEGRTVTLGPRAGDYYVVLDGLEEGARVVSHGAFKIDSELQIRGRPSLMAPAEETHTAEASAKADLQTRTDVPPEFGRQIAGFARAYLQLVDALAADSLERAQAASEALRQAWQGIDRARLGAEAAEVWDPVAAGLGEGLKVLDGAGDLAGMRRALVPVTEQAVRAVTLFHAGQVETLYRAHCPMAFGNQGADWLQSSQEITNPYFGSRMFRCGDITGSLP